MDYTIMGNAVNLAARLEGVNKQYHTGGILISEYTIEEKLLNSVQKLLSGRVNELLGETEYPIPPIEFGQSGFTGLSGEFRQGRNSTAFYGGGSAVVPVIGLSTCERSEKERIVRLDAYTLTITFSLLETPGNEVCTYAYAAAVDRALGEDPALDGAASRAVLTGKKYAPSKHPGTGEGWETILTLRITVEEMTNAG
jgi:hypothetical protein